MYSLPTYSCSSSSSVLTRKALNFPVISRFSQVGLYQFTPWNGLRHVGISISPKFHKKGKRDKCKGKVVYASLFGVGAPEALVIGVVALLIFGPKGLAEVARNLGKTLRAFQPTMRELQEVSREFQNTLQKEISLDEDVNSMSNTYGSSKANTSNQSVSSSEDSQNWTVSDPNGTSCNNAYSSEEYLKITEEQLKAYSAAQIEVGSQSQDSKLPKGAYSDEDDVKVTEEQLKASAAAKQDVTSSASESQTNVETRRQCNTTETEVAATPIEKPDIEI